ncbi:unnamed protein product [Caenorhabditis sp. 36 PRJEB53466]|nr:unnamed protein product [Caenorhabditis sp. 36 PRJEB53466]
MRTHFLLLSILSISEIQAKAPRHKNNGPRGSSDEFDKQLAGLFSKTNDECPQGFPTKCKSTCGCLEIAVGSRWIKANFENPIASITDEKFVKPNVKWTDECTPVLDGCPPKTSEHTLAYNIESGMVENKGATFQQVAIYTCSDSNEWVSWDNQRILVSVRFAMKPFVFAVLAILFISVEAGCLQSQGSTTGAVTAQSTASTRPSSTSTISATRSSSSVSTAAPTTTTTTISTSSTTPLSCSNGYPLDECDATCGCPRYTIDSAYIKAMGYAFGDDVYRSPVLTWTNCTPTPQNCTERGEGAFKIQVLDAKSGPLWPFYGDKQIENTCQHDTKMWSNEGNGAYYFTCTSANPNATK